jgi:hypothetical protein
MADNENQQNQGRQDTQGGAESAADATGSTAPATEPEGTTEGDQRAAGDTERDPVDQTDDVQALRHEAASRRRQLRAAEAERDQLREQIDLYDRQTVERLATGRLADPADAWLAIGALDELRGDDGVLDEAKVEAGLDRIVQERPHWGAPRDHPNLHQGARQPERQAPSFGQALKSGGGRQ